MLEGAKLFLTALVLSSFAWSAAGAEVSADEILQLTEAERAEFMKTWEALVNVDSGTGDEQGLAQVEALLVERLKVLGAEVETRSAQPAVGNNIIGTLQGTGDRKIMLMIHYDTVFPPGEVEKRPFRVDDKHAYGPGVADAKGGVAIILHSLDLLKKLDFEGFGTLTVFFNPDEEKGSLGSRDLIQELASEQDYVLSYELPETDAVTVGHQWDQLRLPQREGRRLARWLRTGRGPQCRHRVGASAA